MDFPWFSHWTWWFSIVFCMFTRWYFLDDQIQALLPGTCPRNWRTLAASTSRPFLWNGDGSWWIKFPKTYMSTYIYMDYVGQNQEFVGIQWDWVRMMWINQISKERWTSRSPSYFGGGHSYMENRRAGGHDETPVIQLADWTCQKLPFWLLASRVFRFGMAWDQPFQIFIHW